MSHCLQKPPKFGKAAVAAEAAHVCAVKGHSGLLSWMEATGDITSLFQCPNSLGACWQPARSTIKFAKTPASAGAARACPNHKEGSQTTDIHSPPGLPHKRLQGISKMPLCSSTTIPHFWASSRSSHLITHRLDLKIKALTPN